MVLFRRFELVVFVLLCKRIHHSDNLPCEMGVY